MANNCMFEMQIIGNKANVAEFAEKLTYMGRIYSADVVSSVVIEGETIEVYVEGGCAWSLETALGIEREPQSEFREEVERLGLSIEAYSSEPGIGFQEHYVLLGKDLVIAEEAGYNEYCFYTDEDAADLAAEFGVKVEMLPVMAAGGLDEYTIPVGGYIWEYNGTWARAQCTLEELRKKVAA